MKTIFEIRPYKAMSYFMQPIFDMVAKHNSGAVVINLAVIEAHVNTIKSIGAVNCYCELVDNTLMIAQNNMHCMTIIEKEVYELSNNKKQEVQLNENRS